MRELKAFLSKKMLITDSSGPYNNSPSTPITQ